MDEFLKVGERTEQLIRAFNIREGGLSRKDDILPDRVFDDPIPAGPSEGQRIDREKFEEALTIYYKLREFIVVNYSSTINRALTSIQPLHFCYERHKPPISGGCCCF